MELTLDTVKQYTDELKAVVDRWAPLHEAIKVALWKCPNHFNYLTLADEVVSIDMLSVTALGDVVVEFTDAWGDAESFVFPRDVVEYPGGAVAYYEAQAEEIAAKNKADEEAEVQREIEQLERNRVDTLETIVRAIRLHGFSAEELTKAASTEDWSAVE